MNAGLACSNARNDLGCEFDLPQGKSGSGRFEFAVSAMGVKFDLALVRCTAMYSGPEPHKSGV